MELSQGKVPGDQTVVAEVMWSFCRAEGPKGQAAAFTGTRDRKAGPPRIVVAYDIRKHRHDPGLCVDDLEAGDDKLTSGAAGGRCEGE